MTRFIYVARPVDQSGLSQRPSLWAGEAYVQLGVRGLGYFAPAKAFGAPFGSKPSPFVEAVNRHALRHADGVLALLPAGVSSVGVPMEIEAAAELGKPVAVVTDLESWSLAGRPGVRVFSAGAVAFFKAINSAAEWLAGGELEAPAAPRELKFKLDGGGELPTRAYSNDAGFDLYCSTTITVMGSTFVDVPLGCSVEIPDDHWGLLTGRSSTLRRRGLLVTQGIIDPGYRGPLFAGVQNMRDHAATIAQGERLAQLILMPNASRGFQAVAASELAASVRGERGFGSSGS